MKAAVVLLSLAAATSASVIGLPAIGVVRLADDGQWKPALDNSVLGSGAIKWLGPPPAVEDGQWRPAHDNSVLGSGAIKWLGPPPALEDGQWRPLLDNSLAGVSGVNLAGILHRGRRSLGLINPNALPVPADTLHVALAKTAQLIQQNTEGTRNVLGGGIPLALPADTPAVAIGKQAHAIAHASQRAITGHGWGAPLGIAPLGIAAGHW